MTQDVTQWLDEIKALKQQLADARREREEAYESAINWQRLYETEAQQRRIEAAQAKQMLETLQQEVRKLKGARANPLSETANLEVIQTTVNSLQTDVELRSHLIQALVECDRLQAALQAEQADHSQTRKSLTTALGDAIDALAKGKDGEKR